MRRQSGDTTTTREDPVALAKEVALLRQEVERLRLHVPTCRKVPKLLVLDLNGLLVHRVFLEGGAAAAAETLPNVMSTWRVNNFLVYERPHVRAFLRFCLENFFVGVWTTASANNATPLLQGLLEREEIAKLAFVWDGKKCTYNGETDPAKPGKPIAFKELRRLWDSKDVAGLFGPDNTLLIDDSHYKASLNPDHTAIHPPAWDDPEKLSADDSLAPTGKLRGYLEALLLAEESIPAFVQHTPFETFAHQVEAKVTMAALLAGSAAGPGAGAGGEGGVSVNAATPETTYHVIHQHQLEQQQQQQEANDDDDDDEEDDIVLAPSLARLGI